MGKVLTVRIREHGHRGPGSFEYKNEINLQDFKQLALVLADLELNGANIEKALREFRKNKLQEEEFPF